MRCKCYVWRLLTKEIKMIRSLVLLFLILFLITLPVTAEEGDLDIDVVFPEFQKVNVTPNLQHKAIGLVGIGYTGNVTVKSPNKEVDLTNKSLEITFIYKDIQKSEVLNQTTLTTNKPVFVYQERKFIYSAEINDTFNLSQKLSENEDNCFQFHIAFLEAGMYVIQWNEKEETYLFSWDDVPGNDNNRLIDHLVKTLNIDWAEDAKIDKSGTGKTITVKKEKNSLELELNER